MVVLLGVEKLVKLAKEIYHTVFDIDWSDEEA